MKTLKFDLLILLSISAMIAACVIACGCKEDGCVPEEKQPEAVAPGQASQDGIHTQHRSEAGVDLGGVTQRPGLSIHWAGSDRQDSSVRPIDVIRVAVNRMEAEQQTDLGGDKNARAMVLLMQAISVLEGTDQRIDGIPVIK